MNIKKKILTNSLMKHSMRIMNASLPVSTPKGPSQWIFWLMSVTFLSGLVLSILSWLELCVENCSVSHDYRLFNLPFAAAGIFFFTTMILFHFLSRHYSFLSQVVGGLIALALGAEIVFMAVQHYQIRHWCPVCVSIAGLVVLATFLLMIGYFKNVKSAIQNHNRGDIMQHIIKGLNFLLFVLGGFLIAFVGVGKFNAVEAAVIDIKERMVFGNKKSPIEIYFVTDWFCPACKKAEADIETLYPEIKNQVAFYFIDYPIHKKSLNFTPYNLAFMINNKPQYFKARRVLIRLANKTETPTAENVEKAAKKKGIAFKELPFIDVKTGIEFFEEIVDKYQLRSTPSVVITNPKKNQVIKFEGRDQISNKKILEGIERIEKLQKPQTTDEALG